MGDASEDRGDKVGVHMVAVVAHQLGQRDAVHVLHDQVRGRALDLEIQYTHDAGVLQHGSRARFFQASLGNGIERAVAAALQLHLLYGHATLDAGIPRNDNGGKAARSGLRYGAVSVEDKVVVHAERLSATGARAGPLAVYAVFCVR